MIIHRKPHFVLIPFMAQGHMIPMVDMARLLADHGSTVTVVTTPANAARIGSIIERVTESDLPIRFVPLNFASAKVGLPEGCENLDAVPSTDLLMNFMQACSLLREPLLAHLTQHEPRPDCFIADAGHYWAHELAAELGIPRLTFNGFGCFALLCRHIFHYEKHKLDEIAADENQPFVMPGLAHRIVMTKAQTPANFTRGPYMDKFRREMMDAELAAEGTVVNSFNDLEAPYVELLQKARGMMKVWTIGPTSLYNKQAHDIASRGSRASVDDNLCSTWLDSMRPNSVVYVSFGSLARTSVAQLVEIGLGLEASNCAFIWVIKAAGERSREIEEWLVDGFEERVRTRGLIIRGWAPQLLILSHQAIGGFVTHCGWNSTLESISAGVPMITWPHFAEQFMNEKLIVEVLKVGVSVGIAAPVRWGVENENDEVHAARGDVRRVVCRLMEESEEVKEMRFRVKDLGKKANKAMEIGGSSHENLKQLVQEIGSGMSTNREGLQ